MSLDEHEHGPITEYHGTVDLPKVLSEGIIGGNPKTRSNHYIPEGLREEELISYTHPDRDSALAYAHDRASRMKLDPNKVGVVGVRGKNLPEAVEHEEPQGGIFGGTNSLVRPGGISPEYLIQTSEDKMKPKKKGIVMIISVGPKMPRKPTDESTPDKDIKKEYSVFDEDIDINNASLRWLPTQYLSGNHSVPIPSTEEEASRLGTKGTGYSRDYEIGTQAAKDKNPDGPIIPLPGFKEMDFGGRQLSGTWVMPNDTHSLTYPDYTFNSRSPHSLVAWGDTPNFYRDASEVGTGKLANEGFNYSLPGIGREKDGFDSKPRLMNLPPDLSAMKDIPNIIYNRLKGKRQERDSWKAAEKELEKLGIFDKEPKEGYEEWKRNKRRPTNTQEAKDMGILERRNDRVITGEPMDLAMRLLKGASVNQTDDIYHYPHELDYDNLDSYLEEYPSATLGDMVTPYLQGQFTPNTSTPPPSHQEERPVAGLTRNQQEKTVNAPFPMDISQTQGIQQTLDEGISSYQDKSRNKEDYGHINNAVRVLSRGLRGNPAIGFKPKRIQSGWNAGRNVSGGLNRNKKNKKLMNLINTPVSRNVAEMVANPPMMSSKTIAASEPMDIAFRLLKGRNLSPAARKHKLEYDTKYESNPKRVKYRVDLNRERRRRGIYGSGNRKDVSHTEGGKLTLENEHDNRARHFKGKGTLRRVKVKK